MVARGKTITAEQRQKMTEGRAAVKEAGRIVGLPVRCKVRVNTPREPRYHGKEGVVSEHNLGEVGVKFGGGAAVWFLPDMLIRVADEKRQRNGGPAV